ncbi:hypothetical protein NQ176_g2713 [Zarea fungicola]|uniref:Uncharacterized protein n=1 Tax=Zarea fungicola TaxID=93591 RepID=A0ACC1NM10_9HYPO|nr:hypothetical protein NQ176_g2713 [Lecanicillium fungicola]
MSVAKYSYALLPSDTARIRLLNLLPAKDKTDEVIISLKIIDFKDSDEVPRYEALSYVWGSEKNPVPIKLKSVPVSSSSGNSGEPVLQDLLVTQNLHVALQHLRSQTVVRSLWVDAICIDQTNLQERSHQWTFMSRIYQLAARVIVWLGPEDGKSDIGLSMLESLGEKVEIDWLSRAIRPSGLWSHERHWADLSLHLPYTDEEIASIAEIINRPWFGRLWVVQEIRLASSAAVVVCGYKHAKWSLVQAAIYLIFRKRLGKSDYQAIRPRLLTINNSFFKWFDCSLRDVLFQTQELACREAGDKVYAVLGITSHQLGIRADYTLRAADIYEDVVRRHIAHYGSLDVLRDCDVSRRGQTLMPTWVPDWANKRWTGPIRFCQASGATRSDVSYPSKGTLRIAAVYCGLVSEATEIRKFDVEPNVITVSEFEDVVREIVRLMPKDLVTNNVAGCSFLEAFCGSLLCSSFPELDPIRPSRPTAQSSIRAIRSLVGCTDTAQLDPTVVPELTHFMSSFLPHSQGRSFIKTAEGHLGLAPCGVRASDILCAPLGCAALIALRPVGSGDQFEVVGESFLYGMVQGEAVLGQMPANVEALYRSHSAMGYRPAYRNKISQETSWLDPRFRRLGIVVRHDQDTGLPFHVESAELVAAGVPVRHFDLV